MSTTAATGHDGVGPVDRGVVDCLVHPIASDRSLRAFLPQPWRTYPLPKPEHNVYPPPFGEYHPQIEMASEENPPAADGLVVAGTTAVITPQMVRDDILTKGGVGTAVLLPLTRGIQPDADFDSAISAAVNTWLAETWLSEHNRDGRFKGSIRVNPRDPDRAVAEIRRWADHPHMVQIGVPLQAVVPYGERQYWPIWEAAVEHGLPVVVHADTGSGIEPAYSAIGAPLTTYAMNVLQPYNGVIHLASLVAQGVFSKFPDSKWVFADGAYDVYGPLFWRFNNEWREARFQTPWVEKPPTEFLADNVRFVFRSCDSNQNLTQLADALDLAQSETMLMFGSGYPYWDAWTPHDARGVLPAGLVDAVLQTNAENLYGLG